MKDINIVWGILLVIYCLLWMSFFNIRTKTFKEGGYLFSIIACLMFLTLTISFSTYFGGGVNSSTLITSFFLLFSGVLFLFGILIWAYHFLIKNHL